MKKIPACKELKKNTGFQVRGYIFISINFLIIQPKHIYSKEL